MKNNFLILVFVILAINFVVAGEETISVIVIGDDSNKNDYSVMGDEDINVTHSYSSIDGYAAQVSEEKLKELQKNDDLEIFVDDRIFYINLDISIPLIEADDVWNLRSNGINLTGAGTTVCVIDTGVDYNHVSLGGCYGNNDPNSSCTVIGGYDFYNDDDDPIDDHGHGTHVSGIVASSDGTYNGVAPETKIIAMKALGSDGSGNTGTIGAAIDWCIANASKFNISIISMSVGDCSNHSTYCNGDPLASLINTATSERISVVVAAGNGNGGDCTGITNTIGPSSPACIQNSIAIGAVNDTDSIYYQRGPLFELLAPGIAIMSTWYTGGFVAQSGTSMSAPHVSGAIAMINQYLTSHSESKTINEIKSILNNTGKRIDDTAGSGYNFTRINVYNALLSIDMDAPVVELISPANGSSYVLENQTFVCNVSDWQLANITFKIWNSTEIYYNETRNIDGTFNQSSFNLTEIPDGEYYWACESHDNLSNLGVGSNFTINIGLVEVAQNYPLNNSYTNANLTEFNCGANTDSTLNLNNLTFYLWYNNSLIHNETDNISGISNSSSFLYNLSGDGEYMWTCEVFDNESSSEITSNFTLNYDSVSPVILDLANDVGEMTVIINWETDEETNYSISGNITGTNSSYSNNHSVSFSGLSSSTTYNYLIVVCDRAQNCVNESSNFTTNEATVIINPPSSGGGGGSSLSVVYRVNEYQLQNGFSKVLKKNNEISFSLASGSHKLKLIKINENSASIEIRSDPIDLMLNVDEEIKLNLTSPNYYDLYVKLNSIDDDEANFTIRKIFEEIILEGEKVAEEENGSEEKIYYIMNATQELPAIDNFRFNIFDYPILFIMTGVLSFCIILKQILSYNKHRKTIKYHKVGRTKKNKHHGLNKTSKTKNKK